MSPVVSLILLLSQPLLSFPSQNDWQLRKDKDDIQVYTRSSMGSSLDEFKGITIVSASIDEVFGVIIAIDQWKEWVPNLAEAALISSNDSVQYHYSETEAPFPVQNRDSYVRYRFEKLEKAQKIYFEAVPNYGPEKSGIVRIQKADGFWLLENIDSNKTKITYQVSAEPGGSIPDWIANAGAVDTPFNTLKGLRTYLEDPGN